jgi:preprotein translocase subunit SecA
VRYTLR